MAHPKYKTSHSKTRRRRANINLEGPALTQCPHCKEQKRLHHVCTECGYYKKREVLKIEELKEG